MELTARTPGALVLEPYMPAPSVLTPRTPNSEMLPPWTPSPESDCPSIALPPPVPVADNATESLVVSLMAVVAVLTLTAPRTTSFGSLARTRCGPASALAATAAAAPSPPAIDCPSRRGRGRLVRHGEPPSLGAAVGPPRRRSMGFMHRA